jgi:hypothetical protein
MMGDQSTGPGLLTNTRRVTFQHGQLLPRSRIPDLHKALVCANSYQVSLKVTVWAGQPSG